MNSGRRHPGIVLLVLLVFFVISFLTNILGPLVPDIISGFELSLALAGFLPFAFFVAYGVMSIPAGMLLERFRERAVMLAAFALAFAGSLLFATTPSFEVALVSLFLIGIGMTMLQVAINPLLRVAGGEEHFAFYSVLGQLVFGAASFVSPFVYSYLVTNLKHDVPAGSPLLGALSRVVPRELPWVSLYWVFTAVTLLMVAILALVRLPKFELKEDERAGAWATHRELLRNRVVWLYFAAIFCYVGSEQGIANWISKFLASYHGFDPQVEGARAVAFFWGLMTAGCLLGLLLLKLFDCRKVLIGFAVAAMASLTAALYGGAQISYYAFMLVGFFLSVMWSIVFSLALNSVAKHHGSVSGILCTGIVGGAFVSLAVGWLGDRFGLRVGMTLVYVTLGYILSIGFWAKPLVDNATMTPRELLASLTGRKKARISAGVGLFAALGLLAMGASACGSGGARSSERVRPPDATAQKLTAGFRYSVYGPEYNPGPAYWRDVGDRMAAKFPGAVPAAVWIVGKLKGQGAELSFPGRSANPLIQFTETDQNEETLTLFDEAGVETWLQVEPGNAPVEELIHLMLDRYGHHKCVVGVGVDVEWYKSVDEPEGQAVTDAEATAWLAAARSHDPKYRLFVKHWLIEKMPPTVREGLLFIDDSQILPSLDAMVEEFEQWGRAFAPAPVGFQIGYETDRPWWSKLADPPAEIGRRLLAAIPNTEGIYWVDFTVLEVFPPPRKNAAAAPAVREKPIVGVKIYEAPASYAELSARWRELGVGSAFASEKLAGDPEFRKVAADNGIAVFVIEPVFQNPEALAKDPDLAAITADGKPARDDWVQFVCPSRAAYRVQRVAEIADVVRRLRPQGLSIDFIRHFVFWEKLEIATAHGSIPNSCFCPHCTSAFAERAGIRIPASLAGIPEVASWILDHHGAAWTDWKLGLITSMTEEIVRAARAADPQLRVALHAVPWRRFDYGGAILRNAGQDLPALSKLVDSLSPMTYAHMLQRPPDWVHSVVLRLAEDSAAPILPSIQVQEAYRPDSPFTAAEFEEDLREALKPPSAGVVFWSWAGFEKEPEKLRVASRVLAELSGATFAH